MANSLTCLADISVHTSVPSYTAHIVSINRLGTTCCTEHCKVLHATLWLPLLLSPVGCCHALHLGLCWSHAACWQTLPQCLLLCSPQGCGKQVCAYAGISITIWRLPCLTLFCSCETLGMVRSQHG